MVIRFRYSTSDPSQNEFYSLLRLPLILRRGELMSRGQLGERLLGLLLLFHPS